MARKATTEQELPEEQNSAETETPETSAEAERLKQFREPPRPKPPVEPETEADEVVEEVAEEEAEAQADQSSINPKEIERLRKEAAAAKDLNKQLKELKKRIADFEREKLTEEQKREADYQAAIERAQDLETKLRSTLATQAIDQAALEAGVQPKHLPRIRKLLATNVTFNDDNEAENAAELVAELVKEIPEFVRQAAPENPGNPASNRRGKSLTLEMLRTMSQDEIAKLDWGEVQKVLSSQTA